MRKLMLSVAAMYSLLASTTARAGEITVKVECWSDASCNETYLADVCGSVTTPGTTIREFKVDCAQPQWIDYSRTYRTCGKATCQAVQGNYVSPSQYSRVADFCTDTGGSDVLVTCIF